MIYFKYREDDSEKILGDRKAVSSRILNVQGIVAEYSRSGNAIAVNGTLMPNEEVELVAEIVGKVVGIYFKEGAEVKKGDLLLKVDDSDLQAQLSRAEFQQKLLSDKLERQRILLKRESISREAFDQLQTDYNMLMADMELLKVKIRRTEIRAPFSGAMGFRYVSEGSYVQPNSKIARLVDNSVLKFEFAIPERYADEDFIGQKVAFHVTGRDKAYKARIYAMDPHISVNTRMLLLRAEYHNRTFELMPGMFAKGLLEVGDDMEYIAIPTESVVPVMDGKKVWIVRDGKAVSVPIRSESRDEKNIEVMEGIAVGDTVITTGLMQLRDGMRVDVKINGRS